MYIVYIQSFLGRMLLITSSMKYAYISSSSISHFLIYVLRDVCPEFEGRDQIPKFVVLRDF